MKSKWLPLLDDVGYHWTYCSLGGAIRVKIACGDDIAHLDKLDQKLWTVLSCPVKGLRFDAGTLEYLDSDKDGRIRAADVVDAALWLTSAVRDTDTLLRCSDTMPLSNFNGEDADGAELLSSSKRVLECLSKEGAESVTLCDVAELENMFAATPFNGDGVITLRSAGDDAEAAAAIDACMRAIGSVKDLSGEDGIDAALAEKFYDELDAWKSWKTVPEDNPSILPFGEGTAAAAASFGQLREKISDFFMRCSLIAFDSDAVSAVDVSLEDIETAACGILGLDSQAVANAPIARPDKKAQLSYDGINPAWRQAFSTFRTLVLDVKYPGATALDERRWNEVQALFKPYEDWISGKPEIHIDSLGEAAIRDILSSACKPRIMDLIAKDLSFELQSKSIRKLDKFLHLYRYFYEFLCNYVLLSDFYSTDPERKAVFEAGCLYIDQRCCKLCIRVEDMSAHADMAALSGMFLIYCSCSSKLRSEKLEVVAVMTEGPVRNLRPGTNAVFRDRDGLDWDAVVTKIIDNPVSVRQAFWSPYRKCANFITEKLNKSVGEKESAALSTLVTAADKASTNVASQAAPGAGAPASSFDIAKFAGIFAAIGMAVGYIGAFVGELVSGVTTTPLWKTLLVIAGILLCISGPSCLMAWLKLRKRNLGPILNANGWAINSDVRINSIFGKSLTSLAKYPHIRLEDPYAEKRTPVWRSVVTVLLAAAVAAAVVYFCLKPSGDGSTGEVAAEAVDTAVVAKPDSETK